jgi:hypothetical protein
VHALCLQFSHDVLRASFRAMVVRQEASAKPSAP